MLLTVVILSYVLLIFPIFVKINIYYDKKLNKTLFGVYIYGFIKILSGYTELVNDGIAIHLTNKKAYLIFYKSILSVGTHFQPLSDYHIIKYNIVLEIGSSENLLLPTYSAIIYNFASEIFGNFITNGKAYVKYNSYVLIGEESAFNLSGEFTVILNILMLILSAIKILVGKLINGKN